MAISFIASAGAGGTSTAISITHGFSLQANDVCVVCIGHDGALPRISDNNGTDPFTEEYDNAPSSNTMGNTIYSRVMDGGEGSTFDFTMDTLEGWSAMVMQFRGVNTSSIWDVSPTTATWGTDTSDTTPATAPSITIVNAGAEGILFVSADSGSVTFSSPTNGYTDEQEPLGGLRAAMYRKNWVSAGATGTTDVTISAGRKWHAIQFALAPAAAGESILIPTGPPR